MGATGDGGTLYGEDSGSGKIESADQLPVHRARTLGISSRCPWVVTLRCRQLRLKVPIAVLHSGWPRWAPPCAWSGKERDGGHCSRGEGGGERCLMFRSRRVGPGRPFGCLGSIMAAVVFVVLVVGLVLLGVTILAVVAGLVIVGLLAVVVDRVLLRLSPKRRERRAQRVRAIVQRRPTSSTPRRPWMCRTTTRIVRHRPVSLPGVPASMGDGQVSLAEPPAECAQASHP